MKIAELKEAESVELRWQRREFPFLLNERHIEEPLPQRLAESEDLENRADHGIEWDQSFQPKNPFPLMLEPGAFAVLAFQPFLEEFIPEPPAESRLPTEIVDQRITRPIWPGFSPLFGIW